MDFENIEFVRFFKERKDQKAICFGTLSPHFHRLMKIHFKIKIHSLRGENTLLAVFVNLKVILRFQAERGGKWQEKYMEGNNELSTRKGVPRKALK